MEWIHEAIGIEGDWAVDSTSSNRNELTRLGIPPDFISLLLRNFIR